VNIPRGNSLGIKPLSETLTLNNLTNLATNPAGMAANSISNVSGGSGNAGKDLGLGNSLTGTSTQDIINRFGVGAGAAGVAGTQALGKMTQGVSAYEQDPYNKFLQDQGNQAINRSAAAKGMLGSGNVLAELAKYGQGMAGAGYQDWFNNQGKIAGYGSPAASNMGNAYAGGRQGQADATSGMISSGANMLSNIMNNPTTSQTPSNQNTWAQYAGLGNTGTQAWQTPGINPNVTTDFTQWLPKST